MSDPKILAPKFPLRSDIDTAYLLTKDYCARYFPKIPYYKLLTTVDEVDEVHGEVQEVQKRWGEPINVRAFAEPTEVTQPLNKFGVEEMRKVNLIISVPDMVDADLCSMDKLTYITTLNCNLGDKFYYGDREYSVLSIVPGKRWANTDLVLFFVFTSEVYRKISESYSS